MRGASGARTTTMAPWTMRLWMTWTPPGMTRLI